MRSSRIPSKLSEPDRPTEETPERMVARLSGKILHQNYSAIQDLVPGLSILPMVKADGYGHGGLWTARTLVGLNGLYGFGVATLAEGRELREGLGVRGRRTRVVVFSGATPWTEEKGQFCEKHQLTPVIASDPDWHAFFKQGWADRIPYELKFNTGMNRLGIQPGLAQAIARTLKDLRAESHPSGVMTHLAMAETPDAPLSRQQLTRYLAIRTELAAVCPAAHFSIANSAAIWNQKLWGLDEISDVVRPGLALYGIPPWAGAPVRGIEPVMELLAPVLLRRTLKRGDQMGYGGAFAVRDDTPVQVAVLAAGYGDGLSRSFGSGKDQAGVSVWISGRLRRFLGVVSMDLSAVECDVATKVGEWAEILGPNVDPWEQAKSIGTIPYELLTSVAPRVQRIHG